MGPKLKTLFLILLGIAVAGCASSKAWVSVPENLVDSAQLPGYETAIRFWGDERPPYLDKFVAEQIRQSLPYKKRVGTYGKLYMLSVSGGGADGAFGAGLLNGWTKSGSRPEFDIVSGVSTGALTAPFAFVGTDMDDELKEVFTTTSTKDVLRQNLLGGLLGGTAIADSTPLYNLISKYATPEFVARVGKAHRNGRRLFIGTVNLEAERPVIWNMGQIANSKNPDKVELFRRVLLASAAIPGVFPPVTIEVVADGKKYQEVHVDGGTISQIFLYPSQVEAALIEERYKLNERRTMYVLLNGQVSPEYQVVKPRTIDIANRAIDTLIKAQSDGDIAQLYRLAQRDNISFNLAYIPSDFKDKQTEDFDRAYMNRLYDVGYNAARRGYKWKKSPPTL